MKFLQNQFVWYFEFDNKNVWNQDSKGHRMTGHDHNLAQVSDKDSINHRFIHTAFQSFTEILGQVFLI